MAKITIDYEEYKELLKYKEAIQNNRIIVTLKSDQLGFKYKDLLLVEKDDTIFKLEKEIEELRNELKKHIKRNVFFSLLKH